MTINDIRRSKYLEFIDNKRFFSRIVLILKDIEEVEPYDNSIYYEATVLRNGKETEIKLIHNLVADKWYADLDGMNLYELIEASTSVADVLCYGDNIVYKLPDRSYAIKVKVVKYFEKYRRFICEYNGERHNLSTYLTRWSDDYIVGVYTYDERRQIK